MAQEILLKLPPFEVDKDNPFGNDRLGRESEIKNLTGLIKTNASPLVMAVDAPWGTGKTAFIDMWAAHINKLNQEAKTPMRALRFNAWKADFAADPLLSFLATMEEQLLFDKQLEETSEQEQAKDLTVFLKKIKALLPVIIGVGASIGAGLLGADASVTGGVGKIVEKTAEELAKEREELADNAIKSCSAQMKATQNFKGALAEYNKQRIVIFVDELDRCRPDYAVKVLERIKHLFEVPGLTFVLAVNREQLCHSIRGLYGADLDADAYLRRFIDIDYALQKPDMGGYLETLFKSMRIDEFMSGAAGNRSDLLRTLQLLVGLYDYTLRDAEQLLTRIVLVLCALEEKTSRFEPALLAFLIVAREKESRLYSNYARNEMGEKELVAAWQNKLEERNVYEDKKNCEVAAYVTAQIISSKFVRAPNKTPSELHTSEQKELVDAYFDPPPTISERERIYRVQVDEGIRANYSEVAIDLPPILRKIEMLDSFRF